MTIQYAQKQLILGSENDLKLTKIVHIAQISTDEIRILFREKERVAMKILEEREQDYKDWLDKNTDPYGRGCFTYAERWAECLKI